MQYLLETAQKWDGRVDPTSGTDSQLTTGRAKTFLLNVFPQSAYQDRKLRNSLRFLTEHIPINCSVRIGQRYLLGACTSVWTTERNMGYDTRYALHCMRGLLH